MQIATLSPDNQNTSIKVNNSHPTGTGTTHAERIMKFRQQKQANYLRNDGLQKDSL